MLSAVATEHAATSILGIALLGIIVYGSVKHGFFEMFRMPLGALANQLALLTSAGLVIEAIIS